MKFVLFMCFSLLFSMFHAVAMPANPMGNEPMAVASEMLMDEHDLSVHCADHGNPCCLGVTLQPSPLLSLIALDRQETYTSLASHLIRHTPDALFRPPKFYPVITG